MSELSVGLLLLSQARQQQAELVVRLYRRRIELDGRPQALLSVLRRCALISSMPSTSLAPAWSGCRASSFSSIAIASSWLPDRAPRGPGSRQGSWSGSSRMLSLRCSAASCNGPECTGRCPLRSAGARPVGGPGRAAGGGSGLVLNAVPPSPPPACMVLNVARLQAAFARASSASPFCSATCAACCSGNRGLKRLTTVDP